MPSKQDLDSNHIQTVSRLASGTSGQVWLAENKELKELRALKVLRHDEYFDTTAIKTWGRQFSAKREQSNFVLGLIESFHTGEEIILVTEYMPGGDLESYICRHGKLDLETARFYAAELCHALRFIHQHEFIHRNLGLEHVLLTASGHIRLTGFGTCKDGMVHESRTTTFCGGLSTAPEILLDIPYGRAVDWWGFGIVLFQMLEAASPFQGEDVDAIFDEILDDSKPVYPLEMPDSSKSILQQLLLRNPDMRLGANKDGVEGVTGHAFFAGTIWEDIAHERVPPPISQQRPNAQEPMQESSVTPVTDFPPAVDWSRLDIFSDF
ncbi:kinase-like protein [Aureobasidium pullulans]|nr:kinase-like protein [Aureobasidium pullulans]